MLIRVHNMLEVRLLHEAARDHGKAQESLALTDPLTGLPNRRLLVDRVSMSLVRARRGQSAMRCCLWIWTVIVLHLSGDADAGPVASKIIKAVSQPYEIEGQAVSVTISAGIALYEAKRSGKNVYRIAI